jgi:hypothetical protein
MGKNVPNNKRYHQGTYIVQNTNKYIGNLSEVYYRSSWEKQFCSWCDNNVNVVRWGIELIKIPYEVLTETTHKTQKIVKKQTKNYIPDFFIEVRDSNNKLVQYLIEIKPMKEINKPEYPKTVSRKTVNQYERSMNLWVKNLLKWEKAEEYCASRGIIFKLVTEKNIFGKV